MPKNYTSLTLPTLEIDRRPLALMMDRRFAAKLVAAVAAFVSLAVPMTSTAKAQDAITVEVVLKNHLYTPTALKVPAGKPFVITIRNEDATPEEFESSALKIEKMVAGHSSASVHVRPLTAGHYTFVGEQHEDTAKGELVAE
jgi:hypothetical protein